MSLDRPAVVDFLGCTACLVRNSHWISLCRRVPVGTEGRRIGYVAFQIGFLVLREEDAWLSDEQLEQVVPSEAEPFHSPVPTRMVSNGEYMPHPQTKQQKHVEHRTKELAEGAAKKLGISRRQFLAGTGGLAASFLAMNEVFGERFFNVNPIEMFESAAYAESAVPSDVFVFDDQTHIVRTAN